MKRIILLALVIVAIACQKQEEQTADLGFSTAITINSGDLKSFDIDSWTHIHYPYKISVSMEDVSNGKTYTTIAANGTQFFNTGTERLVVPYGTYKVSIHTERPIWQTCSIWFPFEIQDTIVDVYKYHQDVIFKLSRKGALVVKDASHAMNGIPLEQTIDMYKGDTHVSWVEHTIKRCEYIYAEQGKWNLAYHDTYGNTDTTTLWVFEGKWYEINMPDSITRSYLTEPIDLDYGGSVNVGF